MMKIVLALFALVIFSSIIPALEFSPAVLEFQTKEDMQSCKKVYFVLDSDASVSDFWAENDEVEWRISNFQSHASVHEIDVNYQSQISSGQPETEVCLTGSKEGNYRGALIFRQGQTGNSIVQFIVWIKLSVKENEETNNDGGGSSGGSSRSRRNSDPVVQSSSEQPLQKFEGLNFEIPEETIELNSPKKESSKNEISILPLALIGSLLILVAFLIVIIAVKTK